MIDSYIEEKIEKIKYKAELCLKIVMIFQSCKTWEQWKIATDWYLKIGPSIFSSEERLIIITMLKQLKKPAG